VPRPAEALFLRDNWAFMDETKLVFFLNVEDGPFLSGQIGPCAEVRRLTQSRAYIFFAKQEAVPLFGAAGRAFPSSES